MKLLFALLPIILFFAVFKYAEGHKDWAAALATHQLGFLVSGNVVGAKAAPVLLATVVVIIATLAQVGWLKLRGLKADPLLWVSLVPVAVLAGATIHFHSETFVKWKPSMLYWAMGLSFWLSPLLFGKNLLRALLGERMQLSALVWHRLNFAWVAFFALMGLLNLWVAYSFSTDTWVNFKLFGGIGLMLLFTLAQGLYLSRHLKVDADAPARAPADSL